MIKIEVLETETVQVKVYVHKNPLKVVQKRMAFDPTASKIDGDGNETVDGFQIYVRTADGEDLILNGMKATTTVSSLKKKIEEEEGMPVNQQKYSN